MKPDKLTISVVEKAIAVPVNEWPGNCFAIASKIVDAKLVEGCVVYGMWTGKIHPASYFASRRNIGFTQHGWINLADGRVMDPTRWVFENANPYLYIGEELEPYVCQCCGHCVEEHEHGFFRSCTCCDCPDFRNRGLMMNNVHRALRLPTV